MAGYTGTNSIEQAGAMASSGGRLFIQKEGILICGKPKEIRYLLKTFAGRYRTVKELIAQHLN